MTNFNPDKTMNETNETTMTMAATTPEAVVAGRMNVPRESFKRWREAGTLREGEHFVKEGRAYQITEAGEAEVLRLIGIAQTPEPEPRRGMIVQQAGVMHRVLRCKPAEGGAMVSVRLMAPRVFASQFRRGDRIEVTATEVEGVFEYDGGKPRRTRI